ncbi:MAG: Glycerate kinase [Firmicutes bacterium]|nr:Glycerate kinase [Bacillota bacterium]MDI6706805.1 glycerate kinase [Bacillota bacterium]
MRIVIAPDSFKGSLDAGDAANIIKEGVLSVLPEAEVELIPMADGGEGTVDAMVAATGGRIVKAVVKGPLMEDVESRFGILGDGETAVIEMASASGLTLVPPGRRNPLTATTYGTGQLILRALDLGCRKFVVGIGGSATVDGGTGMARALGVRFVDAEGKDIDQGGGFLDSLHDIDMGGLDPRIRESVFRAACDVDNPLTGETGAARVYGPQKGASDDMIQILDRNLSHLSCIVQRVTGQNLKDIPGAGAGGGMGFGLMSFLNARLESGVQIVLETVAFQSRVEGAGLIITGEGNIDSQTYHGKTILGVSRIAKKLGIPVVAIAGGIKGDMSLLHREGITAAISICSGPMSVDTAMENAGVLLRDAAASAMKLIGINL